MKTLFLLKMAIFNMTINILNVTMFNRNSTIAQVAIYIEISFLVWGVVYFAIALKQILTNKAIMLLNIKIKNSFVYDQITKQDFATTAFQKFSMTSSLSRLTISQLFLIMCLAFDRYCVGLLYSVSQSAHWHFIYSVFLNPNGFS